MFVLLIISEVATTKLLRYISESYKILIFLIYLFIYSFVRSLIHSFIHSFILPITNQDTHTWSELLAPLVNMIKEGCENKPALLIILVFYFF